MLAFSVAELTIGTITLCQCIAALETVINTLSYFYMYLALIL